MLTAAWLLIGAGGPALYGQILITDHQLGGLREYDLSGAPMRPLLTGLAEPYGIALGDDGYLYVANARSGTIGKYTLSGQTVNAQLISGLRLPTTIALDGNGNLYVGSQGTIGLYTTAGATVNAQLITDQWLAPSDIALDGQGNLFVSDTLGGRIGQYTTSGALVNPSLFPTLRGPSGLAFDGNGHLFAAFADSAYSVVEFNTSGEPALTPIVSGLSSAPKLLALDGQGNLFVGDWDTVREYTTSGEIENPALISGLLSIGDLAIVPEPSALTLCGLGLTALAILRPRRQ